MTINLRNRNVITLKDFSKEEIKFLLELAIELKKAKFSGTEQQKLKGKNIVLIFEKSSTRTRCAFEVAAYDQGANVTYLGISGSQMGKKESMEDTAKVLGCYYDGIEFRGFKQENVDILAKYSGVPVWNGLTDKYHPTQVLADLMTIKKRIAKPLEKVIFTYMGDGRNNMANSLLLSGAIMGMDVRIISPQSLFPEEKLITEAKHISKESGARISVTNDVDSGLKDADVIYTDVWVSMGEEKYIAERVKLLKDYQVDMSKIKKTGNSNVIFMHCLPAIHDSKTEIGKLVQKQYNLKEMEVTDEVFRSKHSVVFEEAENRMHTIKAVMVATLGN